MSKHVIDKNAKIVYNIFKYIHNMVNMISNLLSYFQTGSTNPLSMNKALSSKLKHDDTRLLLMAASVSLLGAYVLLLVGVVFLLFNRSKNQFSNSHLQQNTGSGSGSYVFIKNSGCIFQRSGLNSQCVVNHSSSFNSINSSSFNSIKGSGKLKTVRYNLDDSIKTVALPSIGNLTIKQGYNNSLKVTVDDNLIEFCEHPFEHEKLTLTTKSGLSIETRVEIQYELTITEPIENIEVSGCGNAEIDRVNKDKFSCVISGAGNVFVQKGICQKQEITISGTGNYNTSSLKASESNIKISGVGNVNTYTVNKLDVEISGVGNCNYTGNPQITKKISRSGRVNKL